MDDLEELVAKMRRLGIRHYKTAEFELELGDPVSVAPDMSKEQLDMFGSRAAEAERKQRMKIMFGATSVLPNFERRNKTK